MKKAVVIILENLVFLFFFMIFINIPTYINSTLLLNEIPLTKKNVVFIFDDFHKKTTDVMHGEEVSSIFVRNTDPTQYTMIKVDYKKSTSREVLFKSIKSLLSNNHNVYLNISFAPDDGIYAYLLFKDIEKYSSNPNLHITIASGNGNNMVGGLEDYLKLTNKEALILNDAIIDNLSSDPMFSNTNFYSMEELVDSYLLNDTFKIMSFNFLHLLGKDRNTVVRNVFFKNIVSAIEDENISIDNSNIDLVLDMYTNNINPFLFSSLFNEVKGNVSVINAYIPFDLKERDKLEKKNEGYSVALAEMDKIMYSTNSFSNILNCPVDGYVKTDKVALGLYFKTNNNKNLLTPVIGTSIAAPKYLADIFTDKL